MKKIWDCKIGEVDAAKLPAGADLPMRKAVRTAYLELTGEEPAFLFSGWGGELTEGERACVEDRLPDPAKALDCKGAMDAMDTLSQAMSLDHSYAWAWHCNVAMAAVDAGAPHQEANERAADFMKNAFGVDTRAYEHFPKAAPSPPPSPQPAQPPATQPADGAVLGALMGLIGAENMDDLQAIKLGICAGKGLPDDERARMLASVEVAIAAQQEKKA